MSDKPNDYGFLLNKDIKLHRMWFKQMTKQLGVLCKYYIPKPGKRFDGYGDLSADYDEYKEKVGCIFQDHPDQATLKKMG